MQAVLRIAKEADLPTLLAIENACFSSDRLSRRRFKHWILAENGICILAVVNKEVCGYGLVILRNGSRSARLYSLAVSPNYRGQGIAQALIKALENASVLRQRLFMRLEVAENNVAAIAMYKGLMYKQFGFYRQYYEDGSHALRMQKSIKQNMTAQLLPSYPWYQQSTDFTCGPASMMMAMQHLQVDFKMSAQQEIDIWRQSTTVFMTSGHGGCHPVGLAVAAHSLGFDAEVHISQTGQLFVDGVRSQHKKSVMQMVEHQFFDKANRLDIPVHHNDYDISEIDKALQQGHAVICLISTFQFDRKKAPHWVAITYVDDTCLYFHDPDASVAGASRIDSTNSLKEQNYDNVTYESEMDFQHVPVIKEDFKKLSSFGKSKLRTCVIIKSKQDVSA